MKFNYPDYIMLKFRGKDANIDSAYNYLKIILKEKEWNVNLLLYLYRYLLKSMKIAEEKKWNISLI